jgi:L-ribulokinase
MAVEQLVACGGIAEKSPVLMQLLADITGRPVHVPASGQIPARGAAMFGGVAAGTSGLHDDGFDDIGEAVKRLRPAFAHSYEPDPRATETYETVYQIYRGLHDALGSEHAEWMHGLKHLRREVLDSEARMPGAATATTIA